MGVLSGVKILEMGAIGPVPFCGMLLSDMGAEVVRIDRPGAEGVGSAADPQLNLVNRGRRCLAVDLKMNGGPEVVRHLASRADILIEGFRPGVMEKLGLGPDECLRSNPRLVYGRMTGYGQEGPLANAAGHDINFLALAGALHVLGEKDRPPATPLNFLGDFGGGALFLALGVLAALLESRASGKGQVVDAAMVDGAAALTTTVHTYIARKEWTNARSSNLLDGGAPWYRPYETSDGKYVAVGAIEDKFFARLLELLGLDPSWLSVRADRRRWPELRGLLADVFARRTRDAWTRLFDGVEACVTPVLDPGESPEHPQAVQRHSFVRHAGLLQPAPAPRFSRTPSQIQGPPAAPGTHSHQVLSDWGFSQQSIADLAASGVLGWRE